MPALKRHVAPSIRAALGDTAAVLVVGPRQAGKTTLCALIATERDARILTLDDGATLAAARADPSGFIDAIEGPVMIDEIQRAPELLPAIKIAIDRRRTPGRFLLTGSANVLTLPRVSESLAGRLEVISLWPLSQGEIERRPDRFIDALFADGLPRAPSKGASRSALLSRALRGGYPEVVARSEAGRRRAWFAAYVTTVLQREIRDIAEISGLGELPRLLALVAARATSVLNLADLARAAALPQTTVTRYFALLEATFLVRRISAWSGDRARRLIKAPRIVLGDTGLLSHLAGLTADRLDLESTGAGPLLENFVAMELIKQLAWSETRADLFHFRTYGGQEVDLVLERDDGRLIGVEVKASATVTSADFKGLAAFREITGRRFHRGVTLYTGNQILPFGEALVAMPLSMLWNGARSSG